MGKGGYIGTFRDLAYTEPYGVWTIGEAYREISEGKWTYLPPILGNYTTTLNSTHTYPSNNSSGDLLVVLSGNNGNNQGTASASGFTQLMYNNNNPRIYTGYKELTGVQSGTFNVNNTEAGIVALFKKQGSTSILFDVKGTEVLDTDKVISNNITLTATPSKNGILVACITMGGTRVSNPQLLNSDGMNLISLVSNNGTYVTMLYQFSNANTTYSKNISFNTSFKYMKGILFNIY